MKARLARPVFDRDEHYESASRQIRWVCFSLILITYPSNQPFSLVVLTIMIAVGVYNLLRYHPSLMARPAFASRINSLTVDHVFVLAIVLLSGGLSSPYYPMIFLLIIGVIASFGVAGFALALAGQLIVTLVMLAYRTPTLPDSPEFDFIIRLVLLVIFSLVAVQSVRSRNEEYLLETRFSHRVENERQRLLSLINSLSDAVIAIAADGKVYLYNAAALAILNTNRNINGSLISDLLPMHDSKYASVDLMSLISSLTRQTNRQDLTYIASDGSEMVLDLTISPVHVMGGSGRGGGYMLVFRDITKQKSLDEERDEFISVTSHELRTPLAIAEANLSTALLPGFAKIDPKALNLLNQAHDNVVFLSKLIQDLSTLSRAERGDLKIEKSVVDLKELVTNLARDYRSQAETKGLKLELEVDDETRNVITSEPELREILQNFLTNAIKYTTKGSVTLALTHHQHSADVTVHDTGIGISASDKAKIFAKFYRSEDYRTRATGGTGLGLYITKKLAERLGFEIEFTSKLNHGSTFTLHLPYRVSDEPKPATPTPVR